MGRTDPQPCAEFPMKTYYYLASVANATSQAVRVLTMARTHPEAFASAAIGLRNGGFVVTQMQELTEAQYFAPNQAPHAYGHGGRCCIIP